VRRYVAQINAGQSPWNPLEPPAPTPDEIAATRVPAAFTRPVLTAAVVVVVCVDLGLVAATDQDLDRIAVVPGASVYPLVWNVLLAARNEGFGGTITTMAVAQEPAVRELLGIPEEYAVAAVVPLGRPVKQLTKLRRHPVEELATWERFDGAPFTG
jgi:nitroreductase